MNTNQGNAHVLPDSRAREPKGSQMVDWPLSDGRTVRCEAEKVYCANCGKEYGWVPTENQSFTFWLCGKCFEVYGDITGTWACPDEDFNLAVKHEMEARFGKLLDIQEVLAAQDQGTLGTALEKLAKESPYPVPEKPVL